MTENNREFLVRATSLPDQELDEGVADAFLVAATADMLGLEARAPRDLARAVHAGLPVDALNSLRRAGVSELDLERLVAPARAPARRGEAGRLTAANGAALERVARIIALAERVLGSRTAALRWLRRPSPGRFDGLPPIDWLRSDIGARVVEETLEQAEYGFTA